MKTVELLIFSGANGLDIVGPLEVFASANKLLHAQNSTQGYRVLFTGETTGPVTLGSGLRVIIEQTRTETDSTDYLVIPGGSDPIGFSSDTHRIAYVTQRAQQAKYLVSICTGAFILAKIGCLNGKRCTTHWRFSEQLQALYPSTLLCENAIYVEDDNVFTSAGVTAGIDLALALVERDYGADIAIETARNLVLYLRRPGHQSQFSAPIELRKKAGKQFQQLYDWLLDNLSRPELQAEALAEVMAMSPRHFYRRFHQQTGMTPGKYLEKIRLEKARELLGTTVQPIKSIAYLCGFMQEERMRRLFIKHLGITPSQYRRHFGPKEGTL